MKGFAFIECKTPFRTQHFKDEKQNIENSTCGIFMGCIYPERKSTTDRPTRGR